MSGNNVFLALVAFSFGILCRSLFRFRWEFIAFIFLISVLYLSSYCLRRRYAYLTICVFLLFFALGSGRVALAPEALPRPFVSLIDTEVALKGVVTADPDIRETTQRITVKVDKDGQSTKIIAVAALYPSFSYGERVRVNGMLQLPESFDTDGGRTFDYPHFLAKDGIFALIERSEIERSTEPQGIVLRSIAMLYGAKHAFVQGLTAALPEPSAGLASGLIAGGKQGLGKELLEHFTVAGLLPLVVLSGYNVMIVAEAILRSLSFIPKRIALIIASAAVALFVLAAGGGSSALRAGLMAGIGLFARMTGRTYDALRALIAVFILMLLLNPLLLAYDPGFQFSCIATLGLVLASSPIASRLGFIRNTFMREIVASTLAAQAFVLPLLLYQTGNLSIVAIPANLLVLPIVPLAMLLSFIAGLIALSFPFGAVYAGFPAYLVLSYVIGVASVSAHLPLARVVIPAFPFLFVIVPYMLLGTIVWRMKRNEPSGLLS